MQVAEITAQLFLVWVKRVSWAFGQNHKKISFAVWNEVTQLETATSWSAEATFWLVITLASSFQMVNDKKNVANA